MVPEVCRRGECARAGGWQNDDAGDSRWESGGEGG